MFWVKIHPHFQRGSHGWIFTHGIHWKFHYASHGCIFTQFMWCKFSSLRVKFRPLCKGRKFYMDVWQRLNLPHWTGITTSVDQFSPSTTSINSNSHTQWYLGTAEKILKVSRDAWANQMWRTMCTTWKAQKPKPFGFCFGFAFHAAL